MSSNVFLVTSDNQTTELSPARLQARFSLDPMLAENFFSLLQNTGRLYFGLTEISIILSKNFNIYAHNDDEQLYKKGEEELGLSDLYALERQIAYNLKIPIIKSPTKNSLNSFYPEVTLQEIYDCLALNARILIEQDPAYSGLAAGFLHSYLQQQICKVFNMNPHVTFSYSEYFPKYIAYACDKNYLHPDMRYFDLNRVANYIRSDRDSNLNYLGLKTLYDRYLIKDELPIEMPQAMFMRVAMGLAMQEEEKEKYTEKFYDLISNLSFIPSTPTLFNSGTLYPQLSSCFITTVPDSLEGIFSKIKENALFAKFSGGIGNDWTFVRSMGAIIKSTKGKSRGVIPFLKIANDTAVAVNQGGKRKGAVCAYLEVWHLDIWAFTELKKNTGEERRRTHDMETAVWIPDLFMKRVFEDKEWTLFSPNNVPGLHIAYGKEFELLYEKYEKEIDKNLCKKISAKSLWRQILRMLFETGHPWLCYKDPCNIRSPQRHDGVVHSSNLCTEITLNVSEKESAVCNLGSINLDQHLDENNNIDISKLENTASIAVRMLDNVIDLNMYMSDESRYANRAHRPIGLGIMGLHDVLCRKKIPFASDEAVNLSDNIMEHVSYYAIKASCNLAKERGVYSSYDGSFWSQGIMPLDSMKLLHEEREESWLEYDTNSVLNWNDLREDVMLGMRNSNVTAIAPTATIANICGVSPSIEPYYQNLFVKSNLSGDFICINQHLVKDLKQLGIWDQEMIDDLKFYDGSVQMIDRIPKQLKKLYFTAFEIAPSWIILAAAKRQKWIDQSQSLNLFCSSPTGKMLDEIYKMIWKKGLKTSYYFRSMGATHVEKDQSSHRKQSLTAVIEDECEVCQ